MKKIYSLITILSFSATVFAAPVEPEKCLEAYIKQAQFDIERYTKGNHNLSYDGQTDLKEWAKLNGVSTSFFSKDTLVETGLGLGSTIGFMAVGAASVFGVITIPAGATAALIAVATGATIGGAVEFGSKNHVLNRRLQTFSLITQAHACSKANMCEFSENSKMNKYFQLAQKKGFEGNIIEMSDKISDSLHHFCYDKTSPQVRNVSVSKKIKKVYGVKRVLKESGVI
jgi:hypothetical protein